jgi:AsmA protein
MRKFLKILGIILATIIALIIIGIVALLLLVNPNDFKDRISQITYQETGRQLTIQGNLAWTFYPWLGIKVNDVTLSDSKTFAAGSFAKIGEADLSLELIPLLSSQFQIGKLTLKNLELNLIKNATGESNWQDLTNKTHEDSANTIPATNKTKDFNTNTLHIANVDISNAKINWQDRRNNQNFTIQNLNLRGKNINPTKPFYLETSFGFSSKDIKGEIKAQSDISLNIANNLYALNNLSLSGNIQNSSITSPLPFTLMTNAKLDLEKQTLTLPQLKAKIANLEATANVNGEKISDAPIFHSTISIAAFNPTVFLKYFGMNNQSTRKDLLQTAQAKLDLEASSKFIKITALNGSVDNINLQGNFSVSDFDNMFLSFNLVSNQINLTPYMDLSFGGTKKATGNTSASINTTTLPSANNSKVVSNVTPSSTSTKLDGNLKITSLKIGKIQASDLSMHIGGTTSNLALNPVSANLYQGKISGSINLGLASSTPQIASNVNISNVDIQQLLKTMADMDKLTGRAQLTLNVTTAGKDSTAILNNLNGKGSFAISSGIWNGIDLAYLVNLANATINNKPKPQESNPPKTEFGALTGSMQISNGNFSNDDLLIASPNYHVTGKGKIHLPSGRIDYNLEASDKAVGQPTDFTFPIKVYGTFADLKVRPDLGSLTVRVIQKAAQQNVEKVVGEQLQKTLNIDKESSDKILKSIDQFLH